MKFEIALIIFKWFNFIILKLIKFQKENVQKEEENECHEGYRDQGTMGNLLQWYGKCKTLW